MSDGPRTTTMTTATDNEGLEVLTYDECLQLLGSVPVGRVAFVTGGNPVILPVNHVLDGRAIAFRVAAGSMYDAAGGSAAGSTVEESVPHPAARTVAASASPIRCRCMAVPLA